MAVNLVQMSASDSPEALGMNDVTPCAPTEGRVKNAGKLFCLHFGLEGRTQDCIIYAL